MMPFLFFMNLREKVDAFLQLPPHMLGTNCFKTALRLQRDHSGGEIIWVGDVGETLGMGTAIVGHYYYIPPNALDTDFCLNQADTGYDQYPQLTVEEAREIGTSEEGGVFQEII